MTKMMHDCLVTIADEDLSNDPLAQFMVRFGLDPEGCRSIKVSLLVPMNADTPDQAKWMMQDLSACLLELDQEFPEQAARIKQSKAALDNAIALYSEHHEETFDVQRFIDAFVKAHA